MQTTRPILVTGGAGYIGSTTLLSLINAGYQPIVIDNFSNSSPEALERVMELSGVEVPSVTADIADQKALRAIFRRYKIEAVIHFAALKSVGESVTQPLHYYQCNVAGTLKLLEVMAEFGCKRLIFSSSATVYGDPQSLPLTETSPTSATNPYGRTKLFQEEIFKDVFTSDSEWQFALLRYFNPVGAHESGRIGEHPNGIPNNLMPYIAQVAVGKRESLQVFGDDYPTPDGTGVRDYIHVVDLAEGHVAALGKLEQSPGGVYTYNLGTGQGYSVLEMSKAFEKASGKPVPFNIAPRRPGDVAACYADAAKAELELGWKATRTLEQMCEDAWRWQSQNPNGYDS
ncbi:UDP-glucose 4-epimerase GalE [Pokkaliibacter sp. CJK22405]|uniref:UDP-glucose 4-epimerase GalE n=1 Tax=Pokkaliibacter sp. CJK22405 TaxID=3384615 RepID=UPI003984BF59